MSGEDAQTLPDAQSITRERARTLVKNIAEQHGYLGEVDLCQMSAELRRKVEEAMRRKDQMIGSSVITLAKNLYNSSARFVFELLQNADDNSYMKAKSASIDPFVSFHVDHRRIVLECNEDGFTPENLVAICNVGQSSKAGAQGYIGEKGFFSFSFQHKKEDSGMGMVSPIWEENDEVLDEPLTRITLYLHDTGSGKTLEKQRKTALQQFRELEASFLLFMKNLRRIDVTIYDEEEEPVSSTAFSIEQQSQGRVGLRKKTVGIQDNQDHWQYYHITRETVSDLPLNENRMYTDAELTAKAYAKAEVVLAFPLTHDFVPIVEPQDVFAFLLVRRMGFPFLIQSDFVTDASRQDILRSSPRNVRLLTDAARVFVLVVSQFCKHPTLRFQWMRYLPTNTQHSWDHFWIKFRDDIRLNLEKTPTLWTRTHKTLRCIEDMRRLHPTMVHNNGLPLFPDLREEQYLAVEYLNKDLDLLTTYGLNMMRKKEFLSRVRQDHDRGEGHSIMFNRNTGDDWHARVAEILIECWSRHPKKMKDLTLIPLMNGGWASAETAEDSSIYFSQVKRYAIPAVTRLNLKLVDPKAETNPNRKRLFSLLGVEEAEAPYIRSRILRYHKKYIPVLANSKRTVAFLYSTAHLDQENDDVNTYRGIKLVSHPGKTLVASSSTFYFPNDDPYGAQQLLQPLNTGEDQAGSTFDVSVLHPSYMSEFPTQPEGENLTWKEWLNDKLNIRDVIHLSNKDGLTEECLYIAKHCPDKFLGFLLKYWKTEPGYLMNSRDLVDKLLKIEVLCENGDMYPLGKTYVRSAELEYATAFLRENEFFPWLKQDALLKDRPGFSNLSDVAKALGFGYPKSELEFYLTILHFIVNANGEAEELADIDRIYELYGRIEARHHESPTVKISRDTIRNAFESQKLIYVPANNSLDAFWANPKRCLWEAPAFMTTKAPLRSMYRQVKRRKHIAEFFQTTLAIPDASIYDFLDELDYMSKEDSINPNDVYELYKIIYDMRPGIGSKDIENIRARFEEDSLIYHEGKHGNWHSPSECLWSPVTDMTGMVTLNDIYEDLPEFFIEVLGVPTLTLDMICEKLIEQGRGESSAADVKSTLWLLNSYLQGAEASPNPSPAMESKVFPVKYPDGTVELCSSKVDFFIADRKHLAQIFLGKVRFLDFGVNDIPRLEPFLRWAGLKSRYLSSSVKEISALDGNCHKSLALTDRDISRKAHGLLRIAVHLNSPRVKEGEKAFYELLKRIEVCETDGITSELHLNQDGRDIRVEVSKSELHFQETKDGLTIYVPRNKKDQYLCFLDRIPRALLEWIMTEPSTGICEPFNDAELNVISRVLEAQNKYIALTLDRGGIMTVETEDDSPDNEISSEHNNNPQTPRHADKDNPAWDAASAALYDGSVISSDEERTATSYFRASQPFLRVANTSPRSPRPSQSLHLSLSLAPEPVHEIVDSEYRRLLNKVIDLARSAEFPSRGPFDMAALSQSLGALYDMNAETYQLRTSDKIERDKKIGAAGEVFVFEILSALDPALPGFSRDNWQSTIRKYVGTHEDYADMEPWIGRETADIVYKDTNGILTSLLIEKGYLDSDIWAGARPCYYLEVKSTTQSWETPFYMSGPQYERMQEISHGESGSGGRDSVYAIFRIFNVGQEDMGIKVYVDPNLMRERGELAFSAKTWSVWQPNRDR